jgi:hypothetical protein
MKGLNKQHIFIKDMNVGRNDEMIHVELGTLHMQVFVCENFLSLRGE